MYNICVDKNILSNKMFPSSLWCLAFFMSHRKIQAIVSSWQFPLWEVTSGVNFTCGAKLFRAEECFLEMHRAYFNKKSCWWLLIFVKNESLHICKTLESTCIEGHDRQLVLGIGDVSKVNGIK